MSDPTIILRIPATLDSLALAQTFVHERSTVLGASAELQGRLELVLEELVVNIGSYAYENGGDMEVCCELARPDADSPEMLCIILRDWGVAFDPMGKDTPDLDADIDERPIGGLGIFLVKELAYHCAYQRINDANEFHAYFPLEEE